MFIWENLYRFVWSLMADERFGTLF